jgi:hypothetical protein
MTIRIPNPVPRPVQTFPEIQANYRSLCGTAPANFPLDSYVLVKETMALDWFFERGFVSLGECLLDNLTAELLISKNTILSF